MCQYIVREKKNLVPTDKGLAVYRIVKDKKIADVEMTGMWETALAKIEAGGMDANTFRKGIEVYAGQITAERGVRRPNHGGAVVSTVVLRQR